MFNPWDVKYCFDFRKLKTWILSLIEIVIGEIEEIKENEMTLKVYNCMINGEKEQVEQNFAHIHLKDSKKEIVDIARKQCDEWIAKTEEFMKSSKKYLKETRKFLGKLDKLVF